jgi:SAM-dependent methyltransferase
VLQADAKTITKRFPHGSITFCRCAACGSWCQSPIMTQSALASWLDSEEYRGSNAKSGVAYANYAQDEPHRLTEARGRYARDLAPLLRPRSRVLEIGCATGSLLAVIRDHGHGVLGLDLSKSFVVAARAMYRLEVVKGDISHTDLPQSGFDAVVAMGTVSNFRRFDRCLAQISKLLKPGGIFMFNFPNADSPWVRWLYRENFWMYTPSAITFMTECGCLQALRRAGYKVLRVRVDRQRPSLTKLLQQGRMGSMLPVLRALGLSHAGIPFPIPIPAVRLVIARP